MSILIALSLAAGGVDLEDLSRRCYFTWTSDAGTERHVIKGERLTVAFVPGLDTAVVNGVPVKLILPPTIEAGRVKLPLDLANRVEEGCPFPAKPPPPAKELVKRPPPPPSAPPPPVLPRCRIVIDAGHGGIHTGFVGRTGLMEKDINLDVARELRKILANWGAEVVMTREDDRHFSSNIDEDLGCRVEIVNRANPDLFLSVHTNGVERNPAARGFEVWVPLPLNERGVRSRQLAELIRGELGGVWGSEDRGTKDEHNLRVLKGTHCPAALVELEFVSNRAAEAQLSSHEHRMKLARALADAAREWLTRQRH
jgi:N-acetylmuramoyl-L-alanine amidase